jgi:hypothetical protein
MRKNRLAAAAGAAVITLGATVAAATGATDSDTQTVTITVTAAPRTITTGDAAVAFSVESGSEVPAGLAGLSGLQFTTGAEDAMVTVSRDDTDLGDLVLAITDVVLADSQFCLETGESPAGEECTYAGVDSSTRSELGLFPDDDDVEWSGAEDASYVIWADWVVSAELITQVIYWSLTGTAKAGDDPLAIGDITSVFTFTISDADEDDDSDA